MNETERKKIEAHRSEESPSSRHFGLQRMINFDIFSSSSSYVIFFPSHFIIFFSSSTQLKKKQKSSPADLRVEMFFGSRQIGNRTCTRVYEVNFIIFSWPMLVGPVG